MYIYKRKCWFCFFQVIARIVDGSKFDEFKTMYGETLVTGELDQQCLFYKEYLIHIYMYVLFIKKNWKENEVNELIF